MLFTAPAFMFAFLPLSIIFCILFGKNRRKLCLGVVCAVYQILLNMWNPINLIWLPLLIGYAYFSARFAVSKLPRAVAVLIGTVPLIWLIVMRMFVYYGASDFVYPVGITMPAFCAAAYIWDVAYGERAEKSIFNIGLYLGFYPIMLLGPFVGYEQFSSLTDEAHLNISLSDCAIGVRYFTLGFIKRIAIGAILIDGYETIFAYSWDSPTILIIVLLLVIVYFGVYFSIWGYYDMAVGISYMYGVNVPALKINPFREATVSEYSHALFGGVEEWAHKYILAPIEAVRGKKTSAFLRISTVCVCVVVFIRSAPAAVLLAIPLAAFAMASDRLGLERGKRQVSITGLRAVFGLLMILVIGAFWIFITMAGNSRLFSLSDITFENAEYQTDMLLMSFSGMRYVFVAFMALLTVLPNTAWVKKLCSRLGRRCRGIVDYGGMIALLAMFTFTVVFFLPQFDIYNSSPFIYLVI